MDLVALPSGLDLERARHIAKLRALGFTQVEIARHLSISPATVNRYLKAIDEMAAQSNNREAFLLGLLLGAVGVGLLAAALSED